jgi:hypothetical protein
MPLVVTLPENMMPFTEWPWQMGGFQPKKRVQSLEISRERVGFIIHDVLDWRKIAVKWAPNCMNADQKRDRIVGTQEILEHFRGNIAYFFAQLVLMNETWIYLYDPETKVQCKELRHSSST